MRYKYFFALLILILFYAEAQTPRVDRINIEEYGIYDHNIKSIQTHKLISKTRIIHPEIGLIFGFKYVVVGGQNGETVPLKIVMLFPAGLHTPNKTELTYRMEGVTNAVIGDEKMAVLRFEKGSEIEPGKVIFQLWYENIKLAEQVFEVLKP